MKNIIHFRSQTIFRLSIITLSFFISFLTIQYCDKGELKPVEDQPSLIDTSSVETYRQLFRNKTLVKIYVSPEGDDSALGSREFPLATPEKARDVLRLLMQYNHNRLKKYSVIFLEGTYYRTQPFELGFSDSGIENYPVTHRGEKGKRIVFSGGRKIENKHIVSASKNLPGWKRLNANTRDKIKMIDLRKLGITNFGSFLRRGFALPLEPVPLELFINNRSLTIARWPNNTFAAIDGVKDSLVFQCKDNRLKKWINEPDAWALGYWKYGWAEYALPIKSIDTLESTIQLGIGPRPGHNITKGNQWFAFNILEELDSEGEYYLDRGNGWLYFIPPLGTNPEKMEIAVSLFGNENIPMLRIAGAQYITAQNIDFEKTRSSGIEIVDSKDILISDCTVQNIGTFGILLNGENCYLKNLDIHDIGSYGISFTGGDRKTLRRANNKVENCYIYSYGRVNRTSCPGIQLSGVGHIVNNCEIYNAYGNGIIFSGNYHIIEKNDIHDVCLESDDAGAIYCGRDWALRGNVVRYNFIHHLLGRSYVCYNKGINGIYLDDCASGINVYGNILYKIQTWGIMNGGGRDNIIENNIIVGCRGAHYADRRGQMKEIFIKKHRLYEQSYALNYKRAPWSEAFPELAKMSRRATNLSEYFKLEALVTRYPKLCNLLAIRYSSDYAPEGCVIRNNIGWKNKQWLFESRYGVPGKRGAFKFYTIENNIEDVDPRFIDEDNLNLDIQDDSPAYSLPGFRRIPFEDIGVNLLQK